MSTAICRTAGEYSGCLEVELHLERNVRRVAPSLLELYEYRSALVAVLELGLQRATLAILIHTTLSWFQY